MTRMCAASTLARSSASSERRFNLRGKIRPVVQFYNSSSRVHRLWTSLSKNRTNFPGSVLASMALTQRLEFRQSQSLVMTPQLMQAIKLLQLSNLDLSAFVEEELERNPLLERANDGTEPPVAGEPMPERTEFSDRDDTGSAYGDAAAAERNEMANGSSGEGLEPAQEEGMSSDLGNRAEIEQTLDTGLDNVFSEEPAEAAARTAQDAARTAYTEGGGGGSNDEKYNL